MCYFFSFFLHFLTFFYRSFFLWGEMADTKDDEALAQQAAYNDQLDAEDVLEKDLAALDAADLDLNTGD